MRSGCRFLACAVFALLGAVACAEREAPSRDALASARLVRLPDGAPAGEEELRGPMLINFWATWCGPCRAEMAALDRLSGRLASSGVAVIGVTLDDDLNLAREFVRSRQLSFATYSEETARPLRTALGVRALPHTLIVRSDGTVAEALAGARDWDSPSADAYIRAALASSQEKRE